MNFVRPMTEIGDIFFGFLIEERKFYFKHLQEV